jgi:peptidyl-prolyl cis-trans isomerase C
VRRALLLSSVCAAAFGLVALIGGPGARADLQALPPAPLPPPTGTRVDPAASAAASAAASSPPAASDELVVARVGKITLTAAQVNRRMAEVPPFRLRELGDSPEAIRRAFIDQVLVPELLLIQEAEARGLPQRPELAERIKGTLRSALLADLRKEAAETSVTEDDVKAFYQANIAKFVAPQKVALWRILVGTEAEAKAIIAEVGATPDPKKWAELARAKSTDKASAMRGGNLGLVEPDGETGQRGVKVDKALVEAAKAVKDGDLVPEPVREGDGFAVLWKRQTMRPVTRSLESERAGIRQLLAQERVQAVAAELLTRLRAEVSEQHPEMTEVVTIDGQGDLSRALRPGALPRTKRAGRPQPEPTPNGLR